MQVTFYKLLAQLLFDGFDVLHLVNTLGQRLKYVLVMIGWAVIDASIVLNSLYERANSPLSPFHLAALLAVSAFAGFVLVDARIIVLSFVGSFSLSIFLMVFCLTLPGTLGIFSYYIVREVLLEGSIVMIVRSVLPAPLIICLMGGFFGGIVGERLGFS